MNRHHLRHPRKANRHGVIYVAVLAIATLVMIMAMGAMLAARSLSRASTLANDSDEAAGYAFSAVELARYMITNDTYWRTDYSPGAWFTNRTIGKGTMSATISTADSTFSNMTEDITFLGTGVKGSATQKVKAVLHSVISPYTCMGSVISASGAITMNNVTFGASTAGMSSNGTISASGSQVGISVSGASTVSGTYYQQMVQTNQTPVTFPSSASFFLTSVYSNGTNIPYSGIPGGNINKQLLSPAYNPFGGGLNSSGIYIINCGGKNLQIQNSRIVGTLVVINAGQVQINNSVNWVPALTDYPCLVTQATTLQINLSNNSLQETNGDKVSYNAPGTPYPYPSGTTNSTYTDSYPSAISGLIYTTGNAQLQGTSSIGILIVGGSLQITGTINATYDSTYYSNPPPGFYTNTLTSDSNTFARSVN